MLAIPACVDQGNSLHAIPLCQRAMKHAVTGYDKADDTRQAYENDHAMLLSPRRLLSHAPLFLAELYTRATPQ
jgi:hypothetical protein